MIERRHGKIINIASVLSQLGRPDVGELGGAVIFVASSASDFVNGQILFVDGAMSAVT